MADTNQKLLLAAITRNAGIVLSLPSAGMLRHHKSRFLAVDDEGFWVESVPGERVLIDSLVGHQQKAGISFKAGHQKVVFASPIMKRLRQYRINTSTVVEALLLSFPLEIKAIQRRSTYRVRIPTGADVSAHVWRISEKANLNDCPVAVQEVVCEIRDISVGGMGVVFKGTDGHPVNISTEGRLRIQLTHTHRKILIEGQMHHPIEPLNENQLRAGVQFKALVNDLSDRQMIAQLTRTVGELHREEVRRLRLGLCQAG